MENTENENKPVPPTPVPEPELSAETRKQPEYDRRKEVEISSYTSWMPTKNEVARLLFTIAVIAACFYPDWGALRTMSYVFGVFLGTTLIAHISRKYTLFPYVDMRELYNRAKKEPLGAAIVFASVSGVVMVCIDTASQFFARG